MDGQQHTNKHTRTRRLRQELRNEAAALRDTVGRQAAEMAGLRAMAAAADARSAAAASELGQVRDIREQRGPGRAVRRPLRLGTARAALINGRR